MKNFKLERMAQSIIDDLIQEIHNLESDNEGKDREIVLLKVKIIELEGEIRSLYEENAGASL